MSVVAALLVGGIATPAGASSTAGAMPTYTIAYEGPLSGGDAQLGLLQLYAVKLAINQANSGKSKFGKLPFKLDFKSEDDQGSATQSPTAAQALITDPSVVAVVGPAFSGATKAAEPDYSAANLATVTPSATDPELAEHGWHNFFRVVADDNAQGPADATFAAKYLKIHSVYSVDDASAYASGLAGAFDARAKKLGMKVTHDTVPGTTQCQEGTGSVTEYPPEASKVVTAKPEAVFYAGYYCGFALFAKALRTAGFKGVLMSDDGSNDPHYVKEAGAKVANGTYLSCACTEITPKGGPADASFVKGFTALAHFPPGTYSGESYDATNTVISVMKSLGSHVTRAAMVKALHKVTYQGLTKTVHFLANGNIAGNAVYMYKVKGGAITELGAVGKLAG